MRSAIANDAPAEPGASAGPDPPASAEVVVPLEDELNADGAGACSGSTFAPATPGVPIAAAGMSGAVGILGALKNGAGTQGFEAAVVAATGGLVAGPSAGEVPVGASAGAGVGSVAGITALENAGGDAGTGAAAGGTETDPGDFAEGTFETEPKVCAAACPAKPGRSIATRATAMARCFIGRRL
jgi:hypothetical protein